MPAFDAVQALSIHQRLLEGDPVAAAEIAELLLPLLVPYLKQKFASIDDPHLVEDASHQALMGYILNPNRYDPTKSNLLTYIRLVAYRDLLNLVNSEKRHRNVISIGEYVADDAQQSEYTIEIADEYELEADVIARVITDQRLRSWIPDETDLRVIFLMMENVRETEAYVVLLGLTHLPVSEQEKIVKQHKDRLKKLLRRRWQSVAGDEND